MPWIAGVDGCRAGWLAAFENTADGQCDVAVYAHIADILNSPHRAGVIAVDIPIGLTEAGSRQCDLEARRLLGVRRSSIFLPPIRPVLPITDYARANAMSKRLDGRGLSRQAFNITLKIREVDDLMRSLAPSKRARIRESHPELAFMAMNAGTPLPWPKRTPEGHASRRRLIRHHLGSAVRALLRRSPVLPGARPDDLLDAFALLWTARRLVSRSAQRIPAEVHYDRYDLPMEINY